LARIIDLIASFLCCISTQYLPILQDPIIPSSITNKLNMPVQKRKLSSIDNSPETAAPQKKQKKTPKPPKVYRAVPVWDDDEDLFDPRIFALLCVSPTELFRTMKISTPSTSYR